jgi:hypothetical protein
MHLDPGGPRSAELAARTLLRRFADSNRLLRYPVVHLFRDRPEWEISPQLLGFGGVGFNEQHLGGCIQYFDATP